jgi:hypothetical protein
VRGTHVLCYDFTLRKRSVFISFSTILPFQLRGRHTSNRPLTAFAVVCCFTSVIFVSCATWSVICAVFPRLVLVHGREKSLIPLNPEWPRQRDTPFVMLLPATCSHFYLFLVLLICIILLDRYHLSFSLSELGTFRHQDETGPGLSHYLCFVYRGTFAHLPTPMTVVSPALVR